MLEDQDRVLICLSGGNDSWALVDILEHIRPRLPIRFESHILHLDPGFPDNRSAQLATALNTRHYPHTIVKRRIFEHVHRKLQKNHSCCSLCARFRRGAIVRFALEHGYNRIALGHHADDLIETLFLNLLFQGRIGSMGVNLTGDQGRYTFIRPLALVFKTDLETYVRIRDLPVERRTCPHEQQDAHRLAVRCMIEKWQTQDNRVRKNLLAALQNVKPEYLMDRRLWRHES